MEVTPTSVEAIVTPLLIRKQVKLCGVKVSGRLAKPLIQLFIDWEDSPITIEECVKISREVLVLFDMEERFAPDYRLEVSSPGIDAPLNELWQFRRNISRYIKIELDEKEAEVEIVDVTADGKIHLKFEDSTIEKTLDEIMGARVVLFPAKKSLARRKRNEA